MPKWCFDWRDGAGNACGAWSQGCSLAGRACLAADNGAASTCPAGQTPAVSGACTAAGESVRLPGGGLLPPDASVGGLAAPSALAPLPALAAVTAPTWCALADSHAPVACGSIGVACPVGEVSAGGKCQALAGVDAACPPGFVVAGAVAGAGLPGCEADPADCGSDPWAGVVEAPGVVFIDPAQKGKGTGAQASPFATLTEALAALSDGGTAVLAAGVHPSPVVIQKSIKLRGRCAKLVTIKGSDTAPALRVAPTKVLELEGVTLDGGRDALRLEPGASAKAARVLIRNGRRNGVLVEEKATFAADRVVVRDTVTLPAPDLGGRGISGLPGSQITLTDVRLHANRDRSLYVAGAGTLLLGLRVTVDGTLPGDGAKRGEGIVVVAGAKAVLARVVALQNRSIGVLAIDPGTEVTLTGARIDGTLPQQADGKGGRGIAVFDGARLEVRGARLVGNRTNGIVASGAGVELHAVAVLVQATEPPDVDLSSGEGLVAEGGAHVWLDAVRFRENRSAGLVAIQPGTLVQAHDVLIDATKPRKKDQGGGRGLTVYSGAKVALVDSRISGNRRVGLEVADIDSEATTDGVVIDGTLAGADDAKQGFGVAVEEGGRWTLLPGKGTRVSGNQTAGVIVLHAGSLVTGSGLVVDGTLPQAFDQSAGRGMTVYVGGEVQLANVRLSGNADAGLLVAGSGANATVAQLTVDGTAPNAAKKSRGRGVQVAEGASLALAGARLSANRDVGLYAHGAGTVLSATDVTIDATQSRLLDGQFGRGAAIEGGAVADLTRVRLRQNRGAGLYVSGGAIVTVRDLIVESTLATTAGVGGRGIEVASGGLVRLLRVWTRHNDSAEVLASGAGTVVALADALLDAMPGLAAAGRPLQAQSKAEVRVAGARCATASGPAVAVLAANLQLDGVRATPSALAAENARGPGVIAGGAAGLVVRGCRLDGMRGAGMWFDGTAAQVSETVVAGTLPTSAGTVPGGDAIMARKPGALTLQNVWLAGAARAALTLDGGTMVCHLSRLGPAAIGQASQASGVIAADGLMLDSVVELLHNAPPLAILAAPGPTLSSGAASEP
ncbi:MAG: hypothetical protein EXR79_15060 [Myxococcales bacterium]|nr:hypothetical protein [Myxococcales bacterium]